MREIRKAGASVLALEEDGVTIALFAIPPMSSSPCGGVFDWTPSRVSREEADALFREHVSMSEVKGQKSEAGAYRIRPNHKEVIV